MSEINIQLVREFFELSRFSVLTHWHHADDRLKGGEGSSLLFVEQGRIDETGSAPFLLQRTSARLLQRAIIEVRAWHADKFYPTKKETPRGLAGANPSFG